MYRALILVMLSLTTSNSANATRPNSQWRAGSQVMCVWQGVAPFAGTIIARMGDNLSVLYDDGDHEITSTSMCQLTGPPVNSRTSGSVGNLSIGSRVTCNWQNEGRFYTGNVDLIVGTMLRVLYDEGDEELVFPNQCRVVSASPTTGVGSDGFSPGARVECNWQNIGIYFPGTIESRNGNSLAILYDDGDRENTTTGRCRTF